jgi:hypothetical protein
LEIASTGGNMKKKTITVVLSCLILMQAFLAFAQTDDAFVAAADVVVARPLGIASIIVGTAVFIVAMPFALTSGTVKETADTLVSEPFRFTFQRPVGDFRHKGEAQKD